MMKQNYYCLVAGCPDVTLDMAKPPISENQWREDMNVALSPADKRLVELIYLERDNRRFLDLLTGHDTEITAEDSLHGVFTDEELQEAIVLSRKGEQQGRILPDYFYHFVTLYDAWRAESAAGETTMAGGRLPEDVLTGLYYDYYLLL